MTTDEATSRKKQKKRLYTDILVIVGDREEISFAEKAIGYDYEDSSHWQAHFSSTGAHAIKTRGDLFISVYSHRSCEHKNEKDSLKICGWLNEGKCGFAYFEADEHNDRFVTEVKTFAGYPKGKGRGRNLIVDREEPLEKLWEKRSRIISAGMPDEKDLAKFAYKYAVVAWPGYDLLVKSGQLTKSQLAHGLDKPSFVDDFVSGGDELLDDMKITPIEYFEQLLSKTSREDLLECALKDVSKFPLQLAASFYYLSEDTEVLESLLPGAELELHPSYAFLEDKMPTLFTRDGRLVGGLDFMRLEEDARYTLWSDVSRSFARSFELLLPALKVTIASVSPKSFWVGSPSYTSPKLVVDVELGPIELSELIEQIELSIERLRGREPFPSTAERGCHD